MSKRKPPMVGEFLTIPGWCDRDVEDGVVGVPLHEAPHAQHVAGEGQAAPRPAAPERRVGAVVHLVKPVRRVRELALNSRHANDV